MPDRFIHSKSFVRPSSVTLPLVQCHQVRGLAESGGLRKPSSSASFELCAKTVPNAAKIPTAATDNTVVLRTRIVLSPDTNWLLAAAEMGLLLRMEMHLEELDVDVPVGRDHAVASVMHVVGEVVKDRLLRRRPHIRVE